MIIAVDGPLASGKGTIARALAAHFGLPHLDTGTLYRAVAVAVADAGAQPEDAAAAEAAARALDFNAIDETRIRTAGAGSAPALCQPILACARRFWTFNARSQTSPAARCWTGAISAR